MKIIYKNLMTLIGIIISLSLETINGNVQNDFMKSIRRYADAVAENDPNKIEQAKSDIEEVKLEEKEENAKIIAAISSLPMVKRNEDLYHVPSTRADVSREMPNEHDNFENIRVKNKVYVDKTIYIKKLLNRDCRFIRMCRPRRFGKSNFLQMLSAFFKGNKTLFTGLHVHDDNNWQTHPVIYLDFNIMNVTTLQDFQADLSRTLIQTAVLYGIKLDDQHPPHILLREFIDTFSQSSQSVVVLVDEYDWPVRLNVEIENVVQAEKISVFLKTFFLQFHRVVPSSVKLLFMTCTVGLELLNTVTGVGLRQLDDITFDPEFDSMIGLTHEELTNNFKTRINAMAKSTPSETFDSLIESLRKRYDGYCFSNNTNSTACRLYNFHSVISCLRNQKFENFWQALGNLNYNVIDNFRRQRYILNIFSNRSISADFLRKPYDYDYTFPTYLCMLLHGYLTFRAYDEKYDEYVIDFPNEEIREAVIEEMLKTLPKGGKSIKEILGSCGKIETALTEGNSETFVELINEVAFRSKATANDNEHEHTERISRILQTCDIQCSFGGNYFEDKIIDLEIEVPDQHLYIFKFEWGTTADRAMDTLLNLTKRMGFQENFGGQESAFLMGAAFGREEGAINEWIRVTYSENKCTNVTASHSHYLQMFSYITKTKECIGRKDKS